MSFRSTSIAAIAAAGLLFAAAPAYAEILKMAADLTAAAEVPPTTSTGKGRLEGTFDTNSRELNYTVTYEGLTGPATAAHFHGPANDNQNAPPVVPVEGDLTSPFTGKATLTPEQQTQIHDQKWYFNIHTAAFPDGEIRGKVMPSQ